MMVWQFIKKQCLLLWRNPQELLLLIGMPLVLITILGFALGGIMDKEQPPIHAKVAWVNHGNEEEDIQAFTKTMSESKIPSAHQQMILESAKRLQPASVLKEEILQSKELKKYITLKEEPSSKLKQLKKEEKYDVIIEIPEHFSFQVFQKVFLNEKTEPKLSFYTNEGKQFSTKFIEDLLLQYQKQFTTLAIVGKNQLDAQTILQNSRDIKSSIETVTERKPIRAIMYYTIGMSVMFVLFVASQIASYTFEEKKGRVFDRILLANVSRWTYFSGVFFSITLLAFLQLMVLYGVTGIAYDITWPDLLAFLTVSIALCFAVGGVGVVLTAISFQASSETVINFFSSFLVSIFSFLGGSFFPTGQLSPLIQQIGNFTPNGAAMSAYLKLSQGYSLSSVSHSVIYLIGFGIIMLVVAAASFPKRGKSA